MPAARRIVQEGAISCFSFSLSLLSMRKIYSKGTFPMLPIPISRGTSAILIRGIADTLRSIQFRSAV